MNLTRETLYDKIYACWAGKNIGGTLGAPVEGKMEALNLTFFPEIPDGQALPNDDLDLQLVNLHAAEQYGVGLGTEQIGREWLEHVRFQYDEYGYAQTALRAGFIPPFAGKWDNPFVNCMGSPIRSEIWACAAPGRPDIAAYFAWQDAAVDHAGGEGVFGEIFNAAIEALAFTWEGTLVDLVKKALTFIPASCRTAKAVAETLDCYAAGLPLSEARERILAHHGCPNFTDAPQNIAFTVAGILWGKDFEDVLLKTVNLGYDTDCTVATAGSLWGILYGTASIPEKWSAPVGDGIVLSAAVRGFTPPPTLDDLTKRTMRLGDKLALEDPYRFVMPETEQTDFSVQRWTLPAEADRRYAFCIELRYANDRPSVAPGAPVELRFTFINNAADRWAVVPTLELPCGLSYAACGDEIVLMPGERTEWTATVSSNGRIAPVSACRLKLARINDFALWNEFTVNFPILRASTWVVDGKLTPVDGTLVSFPAKREDNTYTAAAILNVPTTRTTTLICASRSSVTVTLDGEKVIESGPHSHDMPAYHRAHKDQRVTLELAAGRHAVTVVVRDAEQVPEFRFAAVKGGKPTEPGSCYRFVDDVIE
ncbi:MAG: ADP-ribosylglycohydrolase family protein [Clostridia bacterium]|nr:ADP-ribosylglycohydrolase family protein [Clostridia bacterium]